MPCEAVLNKKMIGFGQISWENVITGIYYCSIPFSSALNLQTWDGPGGRETIPFVHSTMQNGGNIRIFGQVLSAIGPAIVGGGTF